MTWYFWNLVMVVRADSWFILYPYQVLHCWDLMKGELR